MLTPPELRKPLTPNTQRNFDYPRGVTTQLIAWTQKLDTPPIRRGLPVLPLGLNLHSAEHLRFQDHMLATEAQQVAGLLAQHWMADFRNIEHHDLLVYRDRHAQFENLWQGESLEWVLNVIDEVPDASPEPEMVVGERGAVYWVRKFEEWPQGSLMRTIVRVTNTRAKVMVDKEHVQNYDNKTKNVAMKGRPFWLIDRKPHLLEQRELTLPEYAGDYFEHSAVSEVLAVYEPINSGAFDKQDTFLSLLNVVCKLDDELVIGDRCPTLQIPHALRDNPEMEVRDAMKLYLSAGTIKNRRIVLEFNKFTTYYAETFGLRHAPVKGGATRYLMGQERAHLHINASPHDKHDFLEIRVEFATEATKAFYGRLVTFLGAFWQHCNAKFGEDLKVDMHRSELVDAGQIEVWGNWAYGEVVKKYPNLAG